MDEGDRKERDGEAQGGGGEEGDEAEGWHERGSRVEFEHERARTASTMPSSDVQRFEIASQSTVRMSMAATRSQEWS